MDCLVSTAEQADTLVVKQHDTHDARWRIPGFNLTGCTVRVMIKRDDVVTVLDSTIVEPATAGIVEHDLPTDLRIGSYLLEIEVTETASQEITTAPSGGYATLEVVADLG